jgi:predicted metal-dependent phosphotriesterase family hydrolase
VVSYVQTANGEVDVDDLGLTLPHEHLFINLMPERRGDGLMHDESLLLGELTAFAALGGSTIFDLTTAELTVGSTADSTADFDASARQTRNPRAVEATQRISAASGVNVVLGTGRYRDPYLSTATLNRLGVAGIAEEMVRDLTEGFPGTTARAGLIGEIGADKWFISPGEHLVFEAAAAAHASTGAAVYAHAARWKVGLEQVRLLLDLGVDPAKVAVGHVDTVPVADYAVELARAGVFIGIDTINTRAPLEVQRRVDTVVGLVRAGFLERILLSHDTCVQSQLAVNGGNGFQFVTEGFRDELSTRGISDAELDVMLRGNPARLLR